MDASVVQIDSANMHDTIANFPIQFREGLSAYPTLNLPQKFNRVLITGMGGSALAGDLVNSLYSDVLPSPIHTLRSYSIPTNWLNNQTLLIICSFSGTTEESIAAYQEALSSDATILVIAAGGTLIDLAKANNNLFINLPIDPKTFTARLGFGYYLMALVQTLIQINWLPQTSSQELINAAEELANLDTETLGKELGERLVGKIPVFYAPEHLWPVARMAKIKVNENAKVPAFWNSLPESNHNETTGFTNTEAPYCLVSIEDSYTHPRIGLRTKLTKKLYLANSNIPTLTLKAQGSDLLTQALFCIQTSEWLSYYLAISLKTDPTPGKLVDDLKAALKNA